MVSQGFRFGPVAYSSDVVGLSDDAFDTLAGVECWIVDALRYRAHPTHAHVEKTLSWIERVRPKRAILTNLHTDLDYQTLRHSLPDGVEPAFDGMRIDL
jgi:phosphoribosyl 1,2-cyclic phosphate phosphodiesterase